MPCPKKLVPWKDHIHVGRGMFPGGNLENFSLELSLQIFSVHNCYERLHVVQCANKGSAHDYVHDDAHDDVHEVRGAERMHVSRWYACLLAT